MSSNSTSNPGIWPRKENGTSGYASDDSLFDEEPQVRMRVGEMYQARVPTWDGDQKKSPHSKEGMLIWSPCEDLRDEKLDSYCNTAKDKHHYNMEQALGMLFWHKHDVTKSLSDMQNFTPMPDDWSMEDKVLFEQAYAFHGKNFRKVQQLIPDKEIGQLVKFYYTWKKSRLKTSLMDKQANKQAKNENDSDDSAPEEVADAFIQKLPSTKTHPAISDGEVKHKLPKGIDLAENDINTLAEHSEGPQAYLSNLDSKLISEKQQVQIERQECGTKLKLMKPIARPPINGMKKEQKDLPEKELVNGTNSMDETNDNA
uniref:REST corepressor 1-like n=1 Tax=Phallusia mammillata TaxID=59560 RepID=A0A6F9DPX7_9ASCI|nr:REST corepressor 1-like [Phallusia mammillata]